MREAKGDRRAYRAEGDLSWIRDEQLGYGEERRMDSCKDGSSRDDRRGTEWTDPAKPLFVRPAIARPS
jgi:hypothetical protein